MLYTLRLFSHQPDFLLFDEKTCRKFKFIRALHLKLTSNNCSNTFFALIPFVASSDINKNSSNLLLWWSSNSIQRISIKSSAKCFFHTIKLTLIMLLSLNKADIPCTRKYSYSKIELEFYIELPLFHHEDHFSFPESQESQESLLLSQSHGECPKISSAFSGISPIASLWIISASS